MWAFRQSLSFLFLDSSLLRYIVWLLILTNAIVDVVDKQPFLISTEVVEGGTMAKTLCKILGIVFLLAGLIGFAMPNMMGMHLSTVHNVVHLLTAALALYFGFVATPSAARTFSIVFGAVYLLIGLLGFIAPAIVSNILQTHHVAGADTSLAMDNVLHILLGGLFLVAGFVKAPSTAIGTETDAGMHPRPH